MAEYEFPVTLGRDFAGVVEETGSGVTRYEVGNEVFGFVPHASPAVYDGSWADYVAIAQDSVAHVRQSSSAERFERAVSRARLRRWVRTVSGAQLRRRRRE
jgi:NADPH:quinone reductase-like Zn-dependent oxidoreductase